MYIDALDTLEDRILTLEEAGLEESGRCPIYGDTQGAEEDTTQGSVNEYTAWFYDDNNHGLEV